jgi:hypothetical protein
MANSGRDRIDFAVEKVGNKVTFSIDPGLIPHTGCCSSCCNYWWDFEGVVRQLEGGAETKA